jgi:hypothetical protein
MLRSIVVRTNSSVPAVGASLPLHGSLAIWAHQAKLDAYLRTSSSLGTPYIQSVHDYYPLALDDGGRLAPLVVDLLTAWPFWW